MSERKKLKVVDSVTVPMRPRGVPDPEVRAVAKRRQFSAAYKLAVLQEAERGLATRGAIGALLRRAVGFAKPQRVPSAAFRK